MAPGASNSDWVPISDLWNQNMGYSKASVSHETRASYFLLHLINLYQGMCDGFRLLQYVIFGSRFYLNLNSY